MVSTCYQISLSIVAKWEAHRDVSEMVQLQRLGLTKETMNPTPHDVDLSSSSGSDGSAEDGFEVRQPNTSNRFTLLDDS